jgi:hypothetical protein
MVTHFPSVAGSPHDWHWPEQSDSQHTPSTHFPNWQSDPTLQASPFVRSRLASPEPTRVSGADASG